MTIVKDWEQAKELAESFIKMCNDSNKNNTLFKEQGVLDLLKEKNVRIYGDCLSSNCQSYQYLSRKHKTPKRFLGRCKGKQITLGEIPETLKKIEKDLKFSKGVKKSGFKKQEVNGSAASIEPVTLNKSENNAMDFLSEEMGFSREKQDFVKRQTKHDTYGAFSVEISDLPVISEKILPVWEELNERKKYNCIICMKRKLLPWKYDRHMFFDHQIDLKKEADLEVYEEARAWWLHRIDTSTDEELKNLPCDYDSDTSKHYSEDESEEESDHYSKKSSSSSQSSSESSSEDSTNLHQK